MKTRGIIFDKDGTLLDFDEFWISVAVAAIDEILKEIGEDASLTDALLSSIGSDRSSAALDGILCMGTYAQMAEAFSVVLGGRYEAAQLENIVIKAFHNNISKGRIVPVCDNIRGVFKELKKRNIKTAVITTDDRYMTEKCIEALGISEYFDRLYAYDGVHPSKPDPYYIEEFCRAEGLVPDELIMVGDTLTDMSFAENGGVRAVGVAKSDRARNMLEGRASAVIHDISRIFEVLDQDAV